MAMFPLSRHCKLATRRCFSALEHPPKYRKKRETGFKWKAVIFVKCLPKHRLEDYLDNSANSNIAQGSGSEGKWDVKSFLCRCGFLRARNGCRLILLG